MDIYRLGGVGHGGGARRMEKRRKHYEGEMSPFHGSCVPRRVRGQPSAVTDLCVVLRWDIIPRHVWRMWHVEPPHVASLVPRFKFG